MEGWTEMKVSKMVWPLLLTIEHLPGHGQDPHSPLSFFDFLFL